MSKLPILLGSDPRLWLEVISAEFELHLLAVEDAVQQHERPKLDRYQDHAFLTAYAVGLDLATGKLKTSELAAFITARALITVRKDPGFDIDGVVARWDGSADLAAHGVGFLLWGLLDVVVDGHFATVRQLDEAIESLEDLLFDGRPHAAEVQRRSFELRKSLVGAAPARAADARGRQHPAAPRPRAGGRGHGPVPTGRLRPCPAGDGVDRVAARPGLHRPGDQPHHPGNRMNSIMKKVTSWAAIIAVPTAVTGFYGMNVPYPGFSQHAGFVTSMALLVLLSGGLFLVCWVDE